jgi:hypothetical protein
MKEPIGWICPTCGKRLAPWIPECDCVINAVAQPKDQYWPLPPNTTGESLPFTTQYDVFYRKESHALNRTN